MEICKSSCLTKVKYTSKCKMFLFVFFVIWLIINKWWIQNVILLVIVTVVTDICKQNQPAWCFPRCSSKPCLSEWISSWTRHNGKSNQFLLYFFCIKLTSYNIILFVCKHRIMSPNSQPRLSKKDKCDKHFC